MSPADPSGGDFLGSAAALAAAAGLPRLVRAQDEADARTAADGRGAPLGTG